MCKKFILSIIIFLVSVSIPAVAIAEEGFLVSGTYGSWIYKCSFHGTTQADDALGCGVEEKIEGAVNGSLAGMLVFESSRDHGNALPISKSPWKIMIAAPLSFSVREKPFVIIDGHTLIPLKWGSDCGPKGCFTKCGTKGCIAEGTVSKVQLDKIKNGHILTFKTGNTPTKVQKTIDFKLNNGGKQAISRAEAWVERSPFW